VFYSPEQAVEAHYLSKAIKAIDNKIMTDINAGLREVKKNE
jgi:hypothetical protein